ALCSTPPAIHRFPGSMAARLQELARIVTDEYDGRAERIWTEAADGRDLMKRVQALPGFGKQKAQIFVALLAKQLDVRPEGWEAALGEALRRVGDGPSPDQPDDADGAGRSGRADRTEKELQRLRSRLADAEQAMRDLRAAHRAQVDEYKADNATLRRKLGDTRAAEREARALAEEAVAAREAAEAEAAERCAGLEKDNRRLRGLVERFEAEAARERRDARSDRDDATLRARVLLETVIDAATGLRRELALPTVAGSPGDRVEADLAAAGSRDPSSAGALGATSAALLEQYLGMPRARLLVDGYNLTKTAWPTAPLEAQRTRLVSALAPLVARTRAETTVVFDAADTDHRPPVHAPRGVRVLFSPRGVIADDVLRDLVAAEPAGRVVVVVTDDRAVAEDVARDGARVVSPLALVELLAR
ncbi:NYN domain-containing protein, partial [Nocardioides sp.]|uniref:NYN domain-containing protein n=1 Tax=Nocardioides sp. TaxID=35761 RepID=UPI0034574319